MKSHTKEKDVKNEFRLLPLIFDTQLPTIGCIENRLGQTHLRDEASFFQARHALIRA